MGRPHALFDYDLGFIYVKNTLSPLNLNFINLIVVCTSLRVNNKKESEKLNFPTLYSLSKQLLPNSYYTIRSRRNQMIWSDGNISACSTCISTNNRKVPYSYAILLKYTIQSE